MNIARGKLVEGMVTTSDVMDPNGRLLVPLGTALTQRHLKAFNVWGIEVVSVEGAEGESDSGPVDSLEEERIRARFVHFEDDDPFGTELLSAILKRAGGVDREAGETS